MQDSPARAIRPPKKQAQNPSNKRKISSRLTLLIYPTFKKGVNIFKSKHLQGLPHLP